MELAPETVDALLARWPVARLATLDADGRPALVPIVFARADGALWSPVDGKPKRGSALARLAHVRRDPRVGLLLDAYADDWRQLWWLQLAARASVVSGSARDPAIAAPAAALRAKYPQYRDVPLFRDTPTLLRFEIDAARSWCASERAAAALR